MKYMNEFKKMGREVIFVESRNIESFTNLIYVSKACNSNRSL